MALTWDISKVKDWQELTEDKNESVITETIIWGCMATDIGEITNANWQEWFTRFAWLEKEQGAWMSNGDESLFMKPEWVKRRIGLKTNVFPAKTRAQWIKKILDNKKRDIQWALSKIESEIEFEEEEVA